MFLRRLTYALLLVWLLAVGGCKKKRPPVPAPQAQAPVIQPAPDPKLDVPAPPAPAPKIEPATTPPAPRPAAKIQHKPKPATVKRKSDQTVSSPTLAQVSPPKIVIEPGQDGSASVNQISAAMPHDEALHARQTTEQLLAMTDVELRSVKRTLTASEQDMVTHIRTYMAQSRAATSDGDTIRARNLALKAHLLSDELIGHH